jgi:hypothetical protein
MKVKYDSDKYYVIKDCCYIKKYNISNDTASWEGWRIAAIIPGKSLKIDYIILRRKFIPPFLEKYSDYSFIITYDYNNLRENYLSICKDKESTELNKDIEIILDSLYNLNSTNLQDYESSIITKYDSLCMHPEVMAFVSNSNLEFDNLKSMIYEAGVKFVNGFIRKLHDKYKNNIELDEIIGSLTSTNYEKYISINKEIFKLMRP